MTAKILTNDATFDLTSEEIFLSWDDKMLMGGDYDLHSSHRHADSLKEVLRQTMLNQEVIFRKQVHELHRLHMIQKSLMKDCGWREFNGYALGKASRQSTLTCEPLVKEETFSRIPMLGSTQSVNNDCLHEGRCICSRLQQRHLDIQLPSSQYINHIGWDLLKKGNNGDSLEKSVEVKQYFCGDDVSNPEEVKLSLSTGGDISKQGVCRGTWNDKITYSSFQHIIDLEESTATVSKEDAKPMFSLSCVVPITTGDKNISQVPAQSCQNFMDGLMRSPFHEITVTNSCVDGIKICQEQNSFNQGLDECHCDLQCKNSFTNGKLSTPCEAAHLDLNKVQLDESSFHSTDPFVAYPSACSSPGVFDGWIGKFHGDAHSAAISWREPNSENSNETYGLLRQDSVNEALMDSNSNNYSKNISATSDIFKAASGSQACHVDLESMSGPPLDLSEDPGNHSRNSEYENVDLPLSFQNGNHTNIIMPEVIGEKGKQDIAFSHPYRSQDAVEYINGSRSPSACKFGCIAEDNSSSTKTMSGTDLGESNLSPVTVFQNFESFQGAEIPCHQDLRSSNNSELKRQCCDKKKGELAEVDVLIQKAALSLLCISLESPNSNQDCLTKAGPNETENKEREQPQYSSDSYESMVLKLKESSEDDYCLSSKPFEVTKMDKKDCGIKLRRGTRLKDFQKDILPALSSLSRHEICEDINIMDGVIRSREYKKLRSKMANGENWFTPIRSRRSRLNYVGRRYYS